jgi:hypothetical protein
MTALSTLPPARRRKQATYGKPSRKSSAWNLSGFEGEDDELAASHTVQVPAAQKNKNSTVKDKYPVQKSVADPPAKRANPSPSKPQTHKKKRDDFDLPSSDDEIGNEVTLRSPPKHALKRKLASAVEEKAAPLAPWEQKKADGAQTSQRRDRSRAQQQPAMAPVLRNAERVERSPEKDDIGTGGAAARLKARRMCLGSSNTKELRHPKPRQSEQNDTDINPTPRKRPRSGILEPQNDKTVQPPDTSDVYAFPDAGVGEATNLKPKSAAVQRARRGRLANGSRHKAAQMDSAPARLDAMLDADDPDTIHMERSPSLHTSNLVTPKQVSKASASRAACEISDTSTHDQVARRGGPFEYSAPSPSVLNMEDLTLHTVRRADVRSRRLPASLSKSSSDVGPVRRGTKLVDRLKALAQSSEDESADESDGHEDTDTASSHAPSKETLSQPQPQSQSQTAVIDSGPKITYASKRSYLPEDSFEDGLMFTLPTESAQSRPPLSRKPSTRANESSQKSTFDMDSSDEDGGGGRLRTIHELRAVGEQQRFIDETSVLLEDIADHNASARGRRRSGMIELAKKLKDKKFAEKFFRQGYEQQLLAECEASADGITDYALAAAIAVLLSGEPPDHVPYSLRDAGVIGWLAGHLSVQTDLKKLAKDRQHNMSKSAQATWMAFVDGLGRDKMVWNEVTPVPLTTRSISLKALDLLVSRIRRGGDRSPLVTNAQVQAIMPAQEDMDSIGEQDPPADITLAISVLESCAITGTVLSWPTDVVERLQALLVSPAISESTHLQFLSLRVCLYLTNDNTKNCDLLSQPSMVGWLMRSVRDGFVQLKDPGLEEERRTVLMDLTALQLGVMINLAEHSGGAREAAATESIEPVVSDLVAVFEDWQKRMRDVDSEAEVVTNVTHGYLAVVLAILCRHQGARMTIASKLPGRNLSTLVDAVAEFLSHHQQVDRLGCGGGEEDIIIWSAFTEKLKGVLERLEKAARLQ